MYRFTLTAGFDQWRPLARQLLAASVEPDAVLWLQPGDTPPLGAERDATAAQLAALPATREVRVPRAFLPRARRVACIRSGESWPLMYRLLYRLNHGEPHLLRDEADPDVHRFDLLDKQVRHDVHRMHAFVRFRRFDSDDEPKRPEDGDGGWYVAWHRPDHRVLRLAVPFFVERFASMRWSILTPDESVHWNPVDSTDATQPTFTQGVSSREAPSTDDELESLWCDYYAAVFNPSRANPRAMSQEMPLRFQHHLPELQHAPSLLIQAPQRVRTMAKNKEGGASAADFIPADLPEDRAARLAVLREAAAGCRGCDLCCEGATQTVFGEGPADAPLIFLGEQPGDQEDLAGRPFVGPSGQLLDGVLEEVGIDRRLVYVTNTVKHFKFVQRGKLRLHQKPGVREVNACRPWLEAEAETLRPKMLVCLGSTAAQAVLGRGFRVTKQRGEVLTSDLCDWTMATLHPSALLRIPDPAAREAATVEFRADLTRVAQALHHHPKPS